MTDGCVFCRIAAKETPAEIEYEDEEVLAFQDLYPKAPVHLLIIPKRHIESLARLEPGDAELIGPLRPRRARARRAHRLRRARLSLSCNCGPEGGQVVYHLHFHFTAGRR